MGTPNVSDFQHSATAEFVQRFDKQSQLAAIGFQLSAVTFRTGPWFEAAVKPLLVDGAAGTDVKINAPLAQLGTEVGSDRRKEHSGLLVCQVTEGMLITSQAAVSSRRR